MGGSGIERSGIVGRRAAGPAMGGRVPEGDGSRPSATSPSDPGASGPCALVVPGCHHDAAAVDPGPRGIRADPGRLRGPRACPRDRQHDQGEEWVVVHAWYAPLVIGAGVTANVLFTAMFTACVLAPRWSRHLGVTGTAMAVPLGAAALMALSAGADPWLVVLPGVLVVFAVIGVAVDVLADVDLRSTRWLWTYLAAFSLAQ